jgi:hypothetical protein
MESESREALESDIFGTNQAGELMFQSGAIAHLANERDQAAAIQRPQQLGRLQ